MTRAELQTLIASIRQAHPSVRIRLHRQLAPSGEFRLDVAVPLAVRIDVPQDMTDIPRALREEVGILIEQASPETRETVRQLQVDRDYASEPVEAPGPPPAPEPPTLWERLESH